MIMEINISVEVQKAFDLSGEDTEKEILQFLDDKVELAKDNLRVTLNSDKTLIQLDALTKDALNKI